MPPGVQAVLARAVGCAGNMTRVGVLKGTGRGEGGRAGSGSGQRPKLHSESPGLSLSDPTFRGRWRFCAFSSSPSLPSQNTLRGQRGRNTPQSQINSQNRLCSAPGEGEPTGRAAPPRLQELPLLSRYRQSRNHPLPTPTTPACLQLVAGRSARMAGGDSHGEKR